MAERGRKGPFGALGPLWGRRPRGAPKGKPGQAQEAGPDPKRPENTKKRPKPAKPGKPRPWESQKRGWGAGDPKRAQKGPTCGNRTGQLENSTGAALARRAKHIKRHISFWKRRPNGSNQEGRKAKKRKPTRNTGKQAQKGHPNRAENRAEPGGSWPEGPQRGPKGPIWAPTGANGAKRSKGLLYGFGARKAPNPGKHRKPEKTRPKTEAKIGPRHPGSTGYKAQKPGRNQPNPRGGNHPKRGPKGRKTGRKTRAEPMGC